MLLLGTKAAAGAMIEVTMDDGMILCWEDAMRNYVVVEVKVKDIAQGRKMMIEVYTRLEEVMRMRRRTRKR